MALFNTGETASTSSTFSTGGWIGWAAATTVGDAGGIPINLFGVKSAGDGGGAMHTGNCDCDANSVTFTVETGRGIGAMLVVSSVEVLLKQSITH